MSHTTERVRRDAKETMAAIDSLDALVEDTRKEVAEDEKLIKIAGPHNFYRNRFAKRVADSSLLAAGAFGFGVSSYVGGFAEMFGQNILSMGLAALDGLGMIGLLYLMSPVVRDLFRRDY